VVITNKKKRSANVRLYIINICTNCFIKFSVQKAKTFGGKQLVRIKIIINDAVLEQVSQFTFLGCDLSFDYDSDVENKLNRFQNMCGTIRRTLRNNTTPIL
jgi:hypothetical protein